MATMGGLTEEEKQRILRGGDPEGFLRARAQGQPEPWVGEMEFSEGSKMKPERAREILTQPPGDETAAIFLQNPEALSKEIPERFLPGHMSIEESVEEKLAKYLTDDERAEYEKVKQTGSGYNPYLGMALERKEKAKQILAGQERKSELQMLRQRLVDIDEISDDFAKESAKDVEKRFLETVGKQKHALSEDQKLTLFDLKQRTDQSARGTIREHIAHKLARAEKLEDLKLQIEKEPSFYEKELFKKWLDLITPEETKPPSTADYQRLFNMNKHFHELIAYSDQTVHSFRRIPSTCSDDKRPVIPQ